MIQLYDKSKNKIAGLACYTNFSIEHMLESGDKTLSFSYAKNNNFYFDIEEECYIKTKENEYVVKELNVQDNYTEYKCILNLEDLEGKPIESFESKEQTIDKALSLAIAGTGWIVGNCNLNKKRTVRITNCSALDVLNEIRKTYRCHIVFNTLIKTIDIYEHLGDDKGTYLIDSLNLQSLNIQGNTYDYCTRIIPIGKDGLTIQEVNNGKNYVENYQYSSKVKTIYWKDDRYTVAQNLKEDAELKLNELSKPFKSYSCKLINLAKISEEYKDILDYNLGDTITLISKENKIKDKQRIVKIVEYPEEHEKDTIELANTILCFEDIQTQFQEAADTVDNITTDNGTVDGSTIDEIKSNQISDLEAEVAKIVKLDVINANINNLTAQNVTITGKLDVVTANIGTLTTNVATIDKLTVTHSATIKELQSNKANITDLEVTNATIKILEANAAKIETLVNGNLSSENIQSGGITGDRLNMKTIFVEDANIVSVNANKINVGELNTNQVKIKSENGGIEIVGATQQFKDKNNIVRIQMGQDAQGNFNFILKGEDGKTTLIDQNGVQEKAIADDLIKSNMIASDSIGEKQIDYNSFSTGFNNDTNTTTLKAAKIKLDKQNKTLEVAFNTLKSTTDNNTSILSSHTTQLNIQQGKIDSIIQDTTIVKDGETVKLKDEYNKTVTNIDSIKSTIGSHTTKIDEVTGKVTNVESSLNIVKKDLDSITQRLSSTETNISSIEDSVNNNKTEITTTKNKVSTIESSLNSITYRVSNVETTTLNINGEVSSLNTRLNSAEQKITDNAIISTVNTQFYSKKETDNRYANQTQIAQLNNKIALKVDINGVRSVIEQNPSSVMIGFNGINNNIKFTSSEMQINNANGRSLSLKNGRLHTYDYSTGMVLGYIGQTYTDINGVRHSGNVFGGSYNSYYTTFGLDGNWSNDDAQTGQDFESFMTLVYYAHNNFQRGIHFNKPVYFNGNAPMYSNNMVVNGNIQFKYSNTSYIGDMNKPLYCIYTNNIRSATSTIEIYGKSTYYGGIKYVDSGYFMPTQNGGVSLGTDAIRFHTIYLKNAPSVSSDLRTKCDVSYINSSHVDIKNYEITTIDMYNFIKDKLKLAEYNYKSSVQRKEILENKKNIGFIAQDLENDLVGERIIRRNSDGLLSYNQGDYTNIIAGALQVALQKIDTLERLITRNYN